MHHLTKIGRAVISARLDRVKRVVASSSVVFARSCNQLLRPTPRQKGLEQLIQDEQAGAERYISLCREWDADVQIVSKTVRLESRELGPALARV